MRVILLLAGNYVRTQWVTLLIMTLYLVGISGVFSLHQERQEVLFFLRSQPLYVLFVALMLAVPAIQTDRKSRRLLALLSKGIHRWQYLGGILGGCGIMTALFSFLIWASAYTLCRRGGNPTVGLGLLAAALCASGMAAAAAGLLYSTFLHPLLATAAAAGTLLVPVTFTTDGMSTGVTNLFFPVAGMVQALVHYHFGLVEGLWSIIIAAVICTVVFWVVASTIFGRRDVTISPE